MKVGDLVVNGQGCAGIVTAVGWKGFISYDDCPHLNPDIHVITADGKRLWSFKAIRIIGKA